MNREDIIRMAIEAGAAVGKPTPDAPEIIFSQCMDVERFAALVASAEREACAKWCETLTFIDGTGTAEAFADEVRNRGQA